MRIHPLYPALMGGCRIISEWLSLRRSAVLCGLIGAVSVSFCFSTAGAAQSSQIVSVAALVSSATGNPTTKVDAVVATPSTSPTEVAPNPSQASQSQPPADSSSVTATASSDVSAPLIGPQPESTSPKPPPVDPAQIHNEKLDFANGLFQREFYDMALGEYQSLIAEVPDNARIEEAYIGAAESLFFLKKYKDSLVRYRSLLKKFPQTAQRPTAIVRMAQCLYRMNKNVLARKVFEKQNPATLSDDIKMTYLFYYGETLKALKNYEKARDVLTHLVNIQVSGDQAWLTYLELADIEIALKNNRKADEWFDQAFQKAGSEEWKSRVLYRKGRAQFETQQYADALKTFQELLDKFPAQPIAQRGRLSLITTLYQLAQYLEITRFYQGHQNVWDFAGADYEILKVILKSFELSRQLEEGLAVAESVLKNTKLSLDQQKDLSKIQADLLLKTKHFDRLKELTQTAAPELWSDDYRLFLKAEASYGSGDYPAALTQYAELREKFPQSEWIPQAVYGTAFAYQQTKQVPEAVRAFNELFNLAGDEQKKRVALYNIVLVYDDASMWNEAITAAEKFLSVFAEGEYAERVRYLRGYFYFKLNNYDQAIDVLNAFLVRYPDSGLKKHALFYLGYSYQSQGHLKDAFDFYGRISISQDDPELAAAVMKNRALMYLQNKQNDDAAKEFHKMMDFVKTAKLDPDLMFWLIEYDMSRNEHQLAMQTLDMLKKQVSGEDLLRANYLTGEIDRQNNQCEQALTAFNLAIHSESNTQFKGLAYLGKIDCLGQMQKYQEADEILKTVFDQYRDDVYVMLRAKFQEAKLEENQGNFEQASKLYMFVAVLYKDGDIVPQALYSAGQIFEKIGKKVDAVKAYSEILQAYSSSAYVQKAQERIKVLQ